jgi:hypothetical protein
VEVSRKHGPFDTRWSCARTESLGAPSTPRLVSAAEVAEALDWHAFSSRFFHERTRHDSEARSAYAAYKHGREWRTRPARLSLVPTEPVSQAAEPESEEAGARRLLAVVAAVNPRGRAELSTDET